MNAHSDWSAWVEKADHDLKAIELLRTSDEAPWDIIVYHAQQAAEKYLKAFLVSRAQQPPKTHDLPTLIELCGAQDDAFVVFVDDALFLSPLAVLSRYPGDPAEPNREDAERGVEIAYRVREAVRVRLPQAGQ
jgi:HEPN domain-containing protein